MTRTLRDLPHLRQALVLGFASTISVCLLFPYLLVLIPRLGQLPIPLWKLIPLQATVGGLQLTALAWVGLRVGDSVGLGAPLLRAALEHAPRPVTRLRTAALTGFATGAILVALDRWIFLPRQPETIQRLAHAIPAWRGLLASFYGGTGEEVATRLFFMTLVAWALLRLRLPRAGALYGAAAVAALAFAAAHLPAAQELAPLSTAVVTRILVLNTVAGLPFGVLYARRGLEHAMVAHFCADLVLHVLAA